jgi:alkylation response protein AidB-like acyl-CoA dehydrogenase
MLLKLDTGHPLQIAYTPQQKRFAELVEAFVRRHWPVAQHDPVAGHKIVPAQVSQWRAAVVSQGWSVPLWPVEFGGTGWNPTEHFIWQACCAAFEVDNTFFDDVGVTVVGPSLIREGDDAARDLFLSGIRQWQERWCLAFFEPHCDGDLAQMSSTLTAVEEGWLLTGHKTLVMDFTAATWVCCLARWSAGTDEYVLVAVPVDSQGIERREHTSLDARTALDELIFHDIVVPSQYLLSKPAPAAHFQHLFFNGVYATLTRSAVAGAQLARIDQSLTALQHDEDLLSQRNGLAVDLAGLQALELRCVDALAHRQPLPVPLEVLRIRSRQILLQLGALQMECFGYYALPYPDEALLHNEGPIGPQAATGAVQRALAQQVSTLYAGDTETLKDSVAKELNITQEIE